MKNICEDGEYLTINGLWKIIIVSGQRGVFECDDILNNTKSEIAIPAIKK